MLRTRLVALTFGVTVTLATLPAQAGDGAAAEALFQQGRAAAQKGDWAGACAKFHESHRIDPTVGTVFNMGDCEEHLGHLATAWQYFREVLQRLPAGDERMTIAQSRASALEKRVPTLSVKLADGAPPGTVVRRGDVELGAASLGVALPVDPGDVVLEARSPGRAPRTFPVHLAEGDKKSVEVAPGDAESKTAEPTAASSSGKRTWGYVAGGVGIASLAVGGIAGILTLGKKSTVDANCHADKRCNQTGIDAADAGSTLGAITTIGLVSGAILTGVGAYLVLSGDDASAPKTAIVPSFGRGTGSLELTRRF